ncbi:MAG: TIGR03749 family integrating conjugative element protein [Burkholderiales bacterium]|jgi:integrating conjugative element protein (TIGR03749 family)|nr:TIGR03749 family integrating conjugative element protein [Burkholderiales bacterium]
MKHPVLKTLVVLGAALLSSFAWAIEIIKWERMPLSVPLRIDEERAIFLDKNVRVGMERPAYDRLRIQSAGGVVYLKATAELPPSRLQIQVIETGELILIDVHTVDQDSQIETAEAVRIVDGRAAAADDPEASDSYAAKVAESLKIPAPVALTRYASQSLYGPLRTLEPVTGLRKVSLRVNDRLRLIPTEAIDGYPLVAYKLGNFTVSAVKLVNRSKTRVELDPRKVQGDFYSVTFQHGWMGSAGTPEDTTVLYLVTKDRGLDQALLPHAYVTDAKGKDKDKNKKTPASSKKENG